MDIDTGTIATGEETIEVVGWRIFREIRAAASVEQQPWSATAGGTIRRRRSIPLR